jgi:hypothetical protein
MGMSKDTRNPRAKLNPLDRARLRVETMCTDRTISKWARGEPVRLATARRLSRAAEHLGIDVIS